MSPRNTPSENRIRASSLWRGALLVFAVILVGVSGFVLRTRNTVASIDSAVAADAGQQSSPITASTAVLNTPSTLQAQIREITQREVRPLKTRQELENYLALLERRARERGRVSSLEVEPGLEATRQLADEIGPQDSLRLSIAFSERMKNLSQQLETKHKETP